MTILSLFRGMNTDQGTLILAGLAIIVSAIIAIKSLNIESHRDKFEVEKGKITLYNLTSRYFLINLQRTDFVGTTFEVKNDSSFTSNYIAELEIIATQMDNLTSSSYFTTLYKKYPLIGVIPVFIRKEIMFIKISNSKDKQYGFDNKVWNNMFATYEILRIELKLDKNEWNDIMENEIYENAKKINDFLLKEK